LGEKVIKNSSLPFGEEEKGEGDKKKRRYVILRRENNFVKSTIE